MFYSTQIFENDAKLSTSAAIAATLATMAVNVLMTFISAVLVDNAGRRTLQLAGLGGMWLSSYLLVISLELTVILHFRFTIVITISRSIFCYLPLGSESFLGCLLFNSFRHSICYFIRHWTRYSML